MTAFVCFGNTRECVCCGGTTSAPRTRHPFRPKEWLEARAPVGPSPRGLTYCSTQCYDSWEEFLDRQDRARSEEWCPVCGYDRFEHAPTCLDNLAHLKERAEKPELYP